MTDSHHDLLTQALAIAATGWPVFPCGTLKMPAIAKAEGGNGLNDATTDPVAVRALFARAPGAKLIGVPTGDQSGLDALDLDYRNGAGEWEREHVAELPETRVHETRSGGRHYLFQHAHGVTNSAGRIGRGCDVRGAGGYVIVPPSPGYRIISDAPIAHWPDWLLQPGLVLPRLRPPPVNPDYLADGQPRSFGLDQMAVDAFVSRTLERVRSAGGGQKHYALRNASLLLGGIQGAAGISDGEATRWLLDALPAGVKDWRNALKTAEWGLRIGRTMPIDLPPPPVPKSLRSRIAQFTFRLLRTNLPPEIAWNELCLFAHTRGVGIEATRAIAEWCVRQWERERADADVEAGWGAPTP